MDKIKIIIIIINGLSRTGKDSFVRFIKLEAVLSVIKEHSTIGTVKRALLGNGMLNANKGPDEREFLNSVKKAWIKYNNGPFKQVVELAKNLELMYNQMYNIPQIYLFVHVREKEEIEKLKKHFKENCITVLIRKKEVEAQPGDEEVFNIEYDFEINNDGNLTDLNKKAVEFLKYLERSK